MNADAMLTGLIAQAAGKGADLVTLRALVEEASEAGTARALARVGLTDAKAGEDVGELRALLGAWREAKKSARAALVGWLVRLMLAGLVMGLVVTVGLKGVLAE
ncbi:DUF6127 family protein [Sphingosinicella soli]|uniref:Uncharacterized protein n=1 Tax=Sphingosinicella soli TaxID=333708 RepID=A0A7W7B4A7_9SPHN|nr:hypothetical protein [Sphingosinicella soli]